MLSSGSWSWVRGGRGGGPDAFKGDANLPPDVACGIASVDALKSAMLPPEEAAPLGWKFKVCIPGLLRTSNTSNEAVDNAQNVHLVEMGFANQRNVFVSPAAPR